MLFGGESLLVMAYGTLARLRVPFISGVIGFVIGVLWMVAHATRMLNQWLVLGLLGMLMLLAYVLLERQQEQLRRFGRDLVVRLREWQ
jgi:Flp pilus assembly protein TadB